MKKKRIAIFGVKYFPSKGGTSRVVENLLWELKDQYDISIYCYKNEAAKDHIPGVKTIQFPEIPVKGFGVFLYYLFCSLHLMVKGKFDLVHLHKIDAAFFIPLLSLKFKLAATIHALPYLNEKWSGLGKFYFKIGEYLLLNSRVSLSTVSKSHLNYFKNKGRKPIRFIPNGIIIPENVNPGLADNLLKTQHIQEDYIFFGARRLIPLKGCHTLIEALQNIGFKGTLLIAGDMNQIPEYTQKLRKLAIGLEVKFIGYVAEMSVLNALIYKSRLFVFPSELEAMSMMLLEVGTVGTPMICSDIPQNTAILGAEEVLFFKSKSVKDLSEKLKWAMANPQKMRAKALNAKETIRKLYLIDTVARKYMEWYEALLVPGASQTMEIKA